ncbi:MAG: DUF3566 domain-containing protein [Candidatus Latescibacteria bacterium]|nr:DUF3566 domain-containing protein [Candidatus Latescibacterota bacterium]
MLMKSAVIKRVDLWSLFKVAFVLYATLGFICGLFYAMIIGFIGSLGALWSEDLPGLGALSGAIGIVAVPILAMVYGVLGSIVVTIGGGLYNLAARFVGGLIVTVDVTDIAPPAGYATTTAPPAS